MSTQARGLVFDVDTFAVHDGPGIRMAVYLKGCPLACRWCHSPEGRRGQPEVILLGERCVLCGACVAVCPRGAHALGAGRHTIHRERCVACERCVEACPSGALALAGRRVAAADLVARAARLKPFFDHSGGGVTLTGGEVTAQTDFAEAVLAGCQAAGVHTAIETCGACPWERLERLLEHTDLVLYDLKLIDEAAHRRWTGASNRQILANARRLDGRDVVVRVPLVPGITDTEANLGGLFDFARGAGLRRVELLPFNASAPGKYAWLGLRYPIEGEPQSPQRLAELDRMARAAGLHPAHPGVCPS
ncbi:MAG: glycyl-radical enzyme activating protein [Candidatus Brocadiia bacterium]